MQADIGVIIPTYNRVEETLAAVNSVKTQTLSPKVILVVDDGSDRYIFHKLKRKLIGTNVKLISIPKSGHPGVARKKGVEMLDTKWIAFLDSDDIWISNKLEHQFDLVRKLQIKAICSNAFVNEEIGNTYFQNEKSGIITMHSLLNNNKILTSSVLIQREELISVGSFVDSNEVRGAEDYATWLRIALNNKWYYSAKPLVVYADNSIDSFRKTKVNNKQYIQQIGLIDFQIWLENCDLTKSFFVKLYFRLLPKLIYLGIKWKT